MIFLKRVPTSTVQLYLANKGLMDFRGKKMAAKLSDDEQYAAVSKYKEGATLAELSRDFDINVIGIKYILEEAGIAPRDRRMNDDEIFTEIAKDYVRGASLHDLEKKYGISFHTIEKRISTMGIKRKSIPTSKYWSDDVLFTNLVRACAKELDRKIKIQELIDFFEISKSSIQHKIKRCNLWDVVVSKKSDIENEWNRFAKTLDDSSYGPTRAIISPKELDVVLPSLKIALEINPTVTHTTNKNIFSAVAKSDKDENYHLQKSIDAKRAGFELVHIFDWDDTSKMRCYIESLATCDSSKSDVRISNCKKSDIEFAFENSLFICSESAFGLEGHAKLIQLADTKNCKTVKISDKNERIIASMIVCEQNESSEIVDICVQEINFYNAFKSMLDAYLKIFVGSVVKMSIRRAINSGEFAQRAGFSFVESIEPKSCFGKLSASGDYILRPNDNENIENYGEIFDCGVNKYELYVN